jgi:DNA modification methylase
MDIDTIICGDNATVLQSFPDDCIDLTVTSPPYDDMDFDYNVVMLKNGLRDYEGYSWNFKELAGQLYRVTKPGGVVVWVVNDPTVDGGESVASSLQKVYFRRVGFNVHDTMTYEKNGPSYPSQDKYYQVFEYMFILSKGKPKTFNPLKDRENKWYGQKWGKTRSNRQTDGSLKHQAWYKEEGEKMGVRFNTWKYNVGAGYTTKDEYAYVHPAMFPEALARDHIITWSNPDDIVLDPFVGSGTTIKMAKEAGRHWVGIDLAKKYQELSRRRVTGANIPLFPATAQ